MWPPFGWEMRKRRGLRVWIISILERSPKNGAEIMDDIELMSKGWWRPSPGSIYPLLEAMTQEGLIKKNESGKYELTQKTREEIGSPFGMHGHSGRAWTVEDMIREIDGYVSYFEDLAKTDRSRISPYADRLKGLAGRLSNVGS